MLATAKIYEQKSEGSQDVQLLALYRYTRKTGANEILRVDIKVDSYAQQSYARIEIWGYNESKWNYLGHVMYPNMKSERSLVQKGGLGEYQLINYQQDLADLLRQAELVLG